MRLVSFTSGTDGTVGMETVRTGVLVGEEIVDLTDPVVGLPGDMCDLLGAGDEALERAEVSTSTNARRVTLESARLLAPVPHPAKVLAIGLN